MRSLVGSRSTPVPLSKYNSIICPIFENYEGFYEKVTIVPHSSSLGYTQFLAEEQHLYNEDQLLDRMVVMMGGRVSEKLFFGKVSTGASDDLKKITDVAYAAVRFVYLFIF
jgi:AFG3 family protein